MDWNKLLDIANNSPIVVERVRIPHQGVSLEGDFDLPALSQLSQADQVFVAAFIQSHGSIKEMERLFGVSYPTIKNRLNKISAAMGILDIDAGNSADLVEKNDKPNSTTDTRPTKSTKKEILDQLECGEITAEEALMRIQP